MLQDNADSGVLGKVQGLVNAGIKWLTTGRKRRGVLTSMQGTSPLRQLCRLLQAWLLHSAAHRLKSIWIPARLALRSCMLGLRCGSAHHDKHSYILPMLCSGGLQGHAKEAGGRV